MKKVFSLIVSFVLCILCYPANILPVVAEDDIVTLWSGSTYVDAIDYDRPDGVYKDAIYVEANLSSDGCLVVYLSFSCSIDDNDKAFCQYTNLLFNDRDQNFRIGDYETVDKKYSYCSTAFRQWHLTCWLRESSVGQQYADRKAYIRTTRGMLENIYSKYNEQLVFDKNRGHYRLGYTIDLSMGAILSIFGMTCDYRTILNNLDKTTETTITTESSDEPDYYKIGDTDADGRISIADSIILNRYLAGTVESLPCSDPPPLAPEDDLTLED